MEEIKSSRTYIELRENNGAWYGIYVNAGKTYCFKVDINKDETSIEAITRYLSKKIKEINNEIDRLNQELNSYNAFLNQVWIDTIRSNQ